MKTQGILLNFCLAFFVFLPAGATVWTVSNNPNIPAQFTNINTAISAATEGDTIYIHGSATVYNYDVNLNKRLVLMGPGYHPQTVNAMAANIFTLRVNKKATKSEITGLGIQIISLAGGGSAGDTINLAIKFCGFTWWGGSAITVGWSFTDLTIENCLFSTGNINIASPVGITVRKGLVIRNNIFGTREATSGSSIASPRDNSIIDHNIFIGGFASIKAFTGAQNCTFSNNIFYGRTIDSTAATNCVFLNNLTYICSYNTMPLPGSSGSENLVGIDPQFVNFPNSPSNFNFTYDFRLKEGSLAKNAGADGTDPGIYGGPNGFSMTGETTGYPVVRSMDIYNSTIPPGGTLDIRIKSSVAVKK